MATFLDSDMIAAMLGLDDACRKAEAHFAEEGITDDPPPPKETEASEILRTVTFALEGRPVGDGDYITEITKLSAEGFDDEGIYIRTWGGLEFTLTLLREA